MPSISSGISIALQAVLTHSQVLEITEHNIANASTPGYRRQSAVLTADMPYSINGADYKTGAGQRGSGVTIERIQRFNLAFFDGRYRAVSSEAASWEAQSGILSQLESVLAENSDDGLLPKLDQFWSGWQSLSNDPTNNSLRTILLDDASSLAMAFNRRSAQITQLRSDQNQVVASQVEEINSLASQIAKLNENISRVISVGSSRMTSWINVMWLSTALLKLAALSLLNKKMERCWSRSAGMCSWLDMTPSSLKHAPTLSTPA
jgi:flagellar hook-associated protein 1 FlgK